MQQQIEQIVRECAASESSFTQPPQQHANGPVKNSTRNVIAHEWLKRVVEKACDRQHAEIIEQKIGRERGAKNRCQGNSGKHACDDESPVNGWISDLRKPGLYSHAG